MKFPKLGKDNWTRTSPAKDGIIFLVLTFIIGFAALNTGNNLIYLIFSMMISLVAISGILSMINISGIEVEMTRHPSFFALIPGKAVFSVKNSKRFPSYSLTFRTGSNTAYLPYLPSGDSREIKMNCFFRDRGWNDMPDMTINTRFPFGFFRKWIKISLGDEKILVYPNVHKVERDELLNNNYTGENISNKSGDGAELMTIREYREGDNTRYIDWKNSAKKNSIMVKEFYGDMSKTARIVFSPESDRYDNIEHYISGKASLMMEYLDRGFNVEFISSDRSITTRKNDESARMVLRYLALY